ncbi:MAG: PDC sensor domain-containing protein [Pseudomonadota bacterium]
MIRTALSAAALLALTLPVQANEFEPSLRALYNEAVAEIIADPALIAAIRAQNADTSGLSEAEILARDTAWRAEIDAGAGPTLDPVMNHPASVLLRQRRDAAQGLFTEIFVMDAVGLNVAASDLTSDYWQGDEAKWQQTYPAGPGAIHISEVEFDESAQRYQSQLSVAITDPQSGAVIGAATFGVDVEYLE